jgi:glycogen debranching enzyme
MPKEDTQAQKETTRHVGLTPEQQQERKNRVLTKGTPSIVRSIADAVVIKEDALFFLTQPDGNVPMRRGHGYGLYYHDCRYLNGYELKLADADPSALVASAGRGYSSVFQLTNPDMRMEDGTLIPKESIGIKWERTVDGDHVILYDVITLQNNSLDEYRFPLRLQFRAEFEDVFAVRGLLQEELGKVGQPQWDGNVWRVVYEGTDGLCRSVSISFSEKPHIIGGDTAEFDITLGPREEKPLTVALLLSETSDQDDAKPDKHEIDREVLRADLNESVGRWLGRQTRIETDSLLLNELLTRCLLDLRVLRSKMRDHRYYAAGLPWFGTLFGRDSAITCLQTLAFNPDVATSTLQLLAELQGTQVNDYKDEQPGKILHSTRVGEMARCGEIPHSPYYGSVDATPLFLILLGQHADWTGDLSLFDKLRDNVDRALEWMDKYGDTDGDGYIDYQSTSPKGLVNQGWKDAGNSIVNADGSIARAPIAMIEVQGYAYLAKKHMAGLFRRSGDGKRAEALDKQADELRERFNRDFWLEKEGYYAMALQKDGEPCAVPSSNPGQAMWTGIVDDGRAKATVEMLTSKSMYNGWGVRTLSCETRSYNPVSYHLGTVWPHDNSIIAAGFKRHGFEREARKVCAGIVDASMHFPDYRLPELFAGFDKDEYGVPVHYPVACHPQAWAAGSVPFIITTLLGLTPEAFDKRLRIVRPTLPEDARSLQMTGLRVGKATADISFTANDQGEVQVEVLKVDGDLDIKVEQ